MEPNSNAAVRMKAEKEQKQSQNGKDKLYVIADFIAF